MNERVNYAKIMPITIKLNDYDNAYAKPVNKKG